MHERLTMTTIQSSIAFLLAVLLLLAPVRAFAHCDGLDGPVVKAAQTALETGNVAAALMWVQERDEAEIRAAFEKTRAVRSLGPEARSLADRYFYETLVRVHRAGEGEPYTGLKPAGRDLGPAIPAADRAIEIGSATAVLELLSAATTAGVHEQLHGVLHAKATADPNDIAAGRRFVAAYVTFIHYVERLFEAATTSPHGHFPEPADAGHPPGR
jgi:hypothetical protein